MPGLGEIFGNAFKGRSEAWADIDAEYKRRHGVTPPTVRDYITSGIDWANKNYGPEEWNRFDNTSAGLASDLTQTLEDTTPIGAVTAAGDTDQALAEGNYLGAGLAALGLIPGAKPVKKVAETAVKTAAKELPEIMSDAVDPIRAYHGSNAPIEQLSHSIALDTHGRRNALGWGKGKFYFSKDEPVARSYSLLRGAEKPIVNTADLLVRNPIQSSEYEKLYKEVSGGRGINEPYSYGYTDFDRDDYIEKLDRLVRERGYDGIVDDVGQVAIFEPDQARFLPAEAPVAIDAPTLPPGPPLLPNKPNVDGTWGDLNRPDFTFEGAPVKEWTPGQFGRAGEAYGASNIGPLDEDAWYASLKPFSNTEGRQFHIPGGLEDTTPFTYFDDLYMKAQGINPATLDEKTRTIIHNRTVAGKQAPPEGWRDEHIANQFLLGMTSPNNPLTPNEFAVAAAHVKGPEDLKRLAEASGMDYDKSSAYLGTQGEARKDPRIPGTPYSVDDRNAKSLEMMDKAGVGAGERGGLGVGGSADWTRISDMAQMVREKPDFFRFRGANEGGKSHEENWANFVDRIITQVPGLKAKTGAFSAVWQDPAKAGVSAIDRHMLAIIRDNVFETPEAAAKWNTDTIKKWNNSVKDYNKEAAKFNKNSKNTTKRAPRQPIKSVDDLAKTPGGTEYFNEEMFKTVNNPAEPKMRTRAGDVSLSVPDHLRPENADYVKEPLHATAMSPGYKRGLQDVSKQAAREGSTGLFSDQWYLWDPQRQRFEPHEVMQPGLIDLPRMSHAQQKEALAAHAEAGYLNYDKNAEGKLQPVQPVPFAEGADVPLSAGREKMRAQLRGLNPSRLAAFAATGAAAAALVDEELARRKEETSPRIPNQGT